MDSRIKIKLRETYLKLKNKNTQRISVTQLCKKSGVSRAAFYLHYKDIDDFISKNRDDIILKLFEQLKVILRSDDSELTTILLEKNLLLNKSERALLGCLFDSNDLIFLNNKSNWSITSGNEALFSYEPIKDYYKIHHLEIGFYMNGFIPILYQNLINYNEKKFYIEVMMSRDIMRSILPDYFELIKKNLA